MAVSLRVEWSKELNLNPKDIVEFIPEIWYELGTIVRDNWFRNTVKSVNIVDVEASYIFCSCGLKAREGDGLLV